MSQNIYFVRDYTKANLIEDLIELFPRLGEPLIIPRSDGSFSIGIILLSDIFHNKYALFEPNINKWVIQTYCQTNGVDTYKFISIEQLIYSNFSQSEIFDIIYVLNKGLKKKFDFSKISPDFHPINRNIKEFEKLFERKNNNVSDVNPDIFLNIPPLKI
jgi:hypothetical protein